jgi:hypothetical protein
MIEEVLGVLGGIMKLASTPGGLAALSQFFADHNITQEKLASVIAALPTPSDPKES